MKIRGWVYLITNKAMPGLVKIGYSTKDPNLRAQELGTTGVPHPFVVEADFLCFNPREVEQMVHAYLTKYREGKEWFRCSIGTAKDAVLQHKSYFDEDNLIYTENSLSKIVKKIPKLNIESSCKDALVTIYIPSLELGDIIGFNPMLRSEVTKRIWSYIKEHNLQDIENRRMIIADIKMRKIFKKDQVSMFEMTKVINDHLKESP